MNLLETFGNKHDILNNILNINNINKISINYILSQFTGKPTYYAYIVFTKNNTEVKHEIMGDSISDLYLKVFNFCETL